MGKQNNSVHPDFLNQLYFSSDITETKKSALFGKVYALELIKNNPPPPKKKKNTPKKNKKNQPSGFF